jgi:hypothetical protein
MLPGTASEIAGSRLTTNLLPRLCCRTWKRDYIGPPRGELPDGSEEGDGFSRQGALLRTGMLPENVNLESNEMI